MSATSLKLVTSDTPAQAETAAARLFAHWVWMMGKNPKRCAVGPKRAKVIADALRLYDEETLALAIDGCAASAWHAGQNDRHREFNDLELIFRDEAHIERFVAEGELLHEAARREAAQAEADACQQERHPPTPEQREALRRVAMRRSGRAT